MTSVRAVSTNFSAYAFARGLRGGIFVEQYANNPIDADHGRLKARLRPMRGLKRHRSARILAAAHAFVQNLRRGHYDIATHVPARHWLRTAFDELAPTN